MYLLGIEWNTNEMFFPSSRLTIPQAESVRPSPPQPWPPSQYTKQASGRLTQKPARLPADGNVHFISLPFYFNPPPLPPPPLNCQVTPVLPQLRGCTVEMSCSVQLRCLPLSVSELLHGWHSLLRNCVLLFRCSSEERGAVSDSIASFIFPERVASQVSSMAFHHFLFVFENNGHRVPNKLLAFFF